MSDTALPTIFHYGTDAQRLAFTPSPASGVQQLYKWYSTDTNAEWSYTTGWHQITSGVALNNYLNYQDQKAQNTAGGTFTSGSWQTRVINTEVSDVGGYGTLASNQITLTAGTYIVSAIGMARLCDRHQMRIQNVTGATTLVVGNSDFNGTSGGGNMSCAQLRGIFTVAASQALELQHQCQTTRSTDGFGVASNFTTEVYAIVELWKIG